MGLDDIAIPTWENPDTFYKKKKSGGMMDNIGFDYNLASVGQGMINNDIWDYGNPYGARRNVPKKFRGKKGKMIKQSQPTMDIMNMDLMSMMSPMTQKQSQSSRKASIKIQGKTFVADPENPDNYIPIADYNKRYGKKNRANKVGQNRPSNVIGQVATRLNEKLSEKLETRRFNKSQPNAQDMSLRRYVITVTKDYGETTTEVFESPNEAYSAQQSYRARGWTVSAVRIEYPE